MKAALIAIALLCCTTAHGREVWSDGGFKLETAGWVQQEYDPTWIGVKCGLSLPPGGWMVLEGQGALELYVPGMGWMEDQGIAIMHGCSPDPQAGRDTRGGACGINEGFECASQGDRVMMMVRLRSFFPTKDNRPTKARWVTKKVSMGCDD